VTVEGKRARYELLVLELVKSVQDTAHLDGAALPSIRRSWLRIHSQAIPVWRHELTETELTNLFEIGRRLTEQRYCFDNSKQFNAMFSDQLNQDQQSLVSRYWSATPAERTKILVSL